MTTERLNDDDSSLGNERVESYADIGVGSYTGVLGRVLRDTTKNGKNRIAAHIFLLRFMSDGAESHVALMNAINSSQPGVIDISMKKLKDGRDMWFDIISYATFPEITVDTAPRAKKFFSIQRKQFAKVFNALSDDGTIEWEKIKLAAGTVVTFDMKKSKDGKWLNIDFETMASNPAVKASISSIKAVYARLDELRAESQAKRSSNTDADDLPF